MNFFGSTSGPFGILPFSRSSHDVVTDPDSRIYNIQTADGTYGSTFYAEHLFYLWYGVKMFSVATSGFGPGLGSRYRRTNYVAFDNDSITDTPLTRTTGSPCSPGKFISLPGGTFPFLWDFSSSFSYPLDVLGKEGNNYGYALQTKFPNGSTNSVSFIQEDLSDLSWVDSPQGDDYEEIVVMERYWDMEYTQTGNVITVTMFPLDLLRWTSIDGLKFVYQVKVGDAVVSVTPIVDNTNQVTTVTFTLPSGIPLSPIEFFSNSGDTSVGAENRQDYWVSPFRIKT